jgi:hypothetical protein
MNESNPQVYRWDADDWRVMVLVGNDVYVTHSIHTTQAAAQVARDALEKEPK